MYFSRAKCESLRRFNAGKGTLYTLWAVSFGFGSGSLLPHELTERKELGTFLAFRNSDAKYLR